MITDRNIASDKPAEGKANSSDGLAYGSTPRLEAVCGLLLVVNQMTKGALLIVILMLTVFIGALGDGLVRDLDINCGCFSLSDTSRFSLVRALLQDVLMLFVAVWIFLLQLNWIHRPKTRESGSG